MRYGRSRISCFRHRHIPLRHQSHQPPPHTPPFSPLIYTTTMGIEEFLPAILVIAVIYYAIRWFMGPSTSLFAQPELCPKPDTETKAKADKIGQTINPDGSIPGVTASMVFIPFQRYRRWLMECRWRPYNLLSRIYHLQTSFIT